MKTYKIHNNFNISFKVQVHLNNCIIYKYLNSIYIPFQTIKFEKIFIGKDIRQRQGYFEYNETLNTIKFVQTHNKYDKYKKENGNSILLKIEQNHYMYIGDKIYEFDTDDEILDYISPIGNNDVPYPYAFSGRYTYIMLDNKKIKNIDLNDSDPYDYYYDINENASGLKYIHEQCKLKSEGKSYNHEIDRDDEEVEAEEKQYFNIPVKTEEDRLKYLMYRTNKYNIDKMYLELYKKFELFDINLIN